MQVSSTLYAAAAGVTFQVAKVDGVQHKDGGSHVVCSDGTRIRGCMVLDATGHARKLVEYDKPFDPGYQVPILPHPPGNWLCLACGLWQAAHSRQAQCAMAGVLWDVLGGLAEPAAVPVQGAYGIMAEVESHPFATDAMLFMDWRDDHTSSDPEMQESNRCANSARLSLLGHPAILPICGFCMRRSSGGDG